MDFKVASLTRLLKSRVPLKLTECQQHEYQIQESLINLKLKALKKLKLRRLINLKRIMFTFKSKNMTRLVQIKK